MTGFVDIQAAIVSKLRKIDPDVDVNSADVEEGFKRPCFFIDIVDVNVENLMDRIEEKEIEFDVVYFPKHPKKNQIDLLEMRDKLTKSFVEIFEVDKILHCRFNIFIAEEYEKVYEGNMEELEFKEGINADK